MIELPTVIPRLLLFLELLSAVSKTRCSEESVVFSDNHVRPLIEGVKQTV